jgi:hypothetical protein
MRINQANSDFTLSITDRPTDAGPEKVTTGSGTAATGLDPEKISALSAHLDTLGIEGSVDAEGVLRLPGVGEFTLGDDFDVEQTMAKISGLIGDDGLSTADALDALKSLLGEMGIGDDLATLMVEFAAMGRQNALDQRLASREQAKAELLSQAQTTRTAAVTQAIVAGVSLVASIASAGVSYGGAKAASKSADEVADAAAKGGNEAQIAAMNAATTAKQATTQTATQAINMTGQLAQGTGGVISGNIQADGQVDAANAQMEQSNSDLAKKVMDDFEEIVRATIQFLKEMQQAETELMANMTRV